MADTWLIESVQELEAVGMKAEDAEKILRAGRSYAEAVGGDLVGAIKSVLAGPPGLSSKSSVPALRERLEIAEAQRRG